MESIWSARKKNMVSRGPSVQRAWNRLERTPINPGTVEGFSRLPHSDCQLRVKALRSFPWLISRSLRARGTSLAGGFWAGKEVLGVHGDNAVVRMSNIINLLRIYGGRITGRRARVWHGGPDGGLIF
jgi:hypothetical protein